jgi:hypothetical protein
MTITQQPTLQPIANSLTMQQLLGYTPPIQQLPSAPAPNASALTPEVLQRYIAKEGIGSPAQAAQIALLAWQNGDIAVAQFAAKIATNYNISKLIAGQDGNTTSISWQDLGALAKGKNAITREDIGAAPDLTEALESDLRAMAALGGGATQPNRWDPYATTMYPQQQPMQQQPMQGQPATLNGVNGAVVMLPYNQAQQLQQSQQGQILSPQQTANLTPLQQSVNLAGISNLTPLMQQAGLTASNPSLYSQQQVASIPAAISSPISSGVMLPQQQAASSQPVYILPQANNGQQMVQPQYAQQPLPVTLPGNYRLALIPM